MLLNKIILNGKCLVMSNDLIIFFKFSVWKWDLSGWSNLIKIAMTKILCGESLWKRTWAITHREKVKSTAVCKVWSSQYKAKNDPWLWSPLLSRDQWSIQGMKPEPDYKMCLKAPTKFGYKAEVLFSHKLLSSVWIHLTLGQPDDFLLRGVLHVCFVFLILPVQC